MAGERPAVAIDTLDECDRRIINALQGDFPLSDEPYREAAESLGLSETELLARLKRLDLLARRVNANAARSPAKTAGAAPAPNCSPAKFA